MEISGRIKKIFDTQNVTASFKKRELVITTQEQYPQDIIMEFTQDKTDLLNSYKAGDEVRVSINIRGREWVNPEGVAKYFNSIQGWRIEYLANSAAGAPPSDFAAMPPVPPTEQYANEAEDDLPF